MNRREIGELYKPVTPTTHPRVLVGWNGPRKGMDFALLFQDDLGEWDRSGSIYPTKAEAFANVGWMAAQYFGTEAPFKRFEVANQDRPGERMSMTSARAGGALLPGRQTGGGLRLRG